MENQKHGYIPLYRSIKKQPWAKDVYLRTLWENILLDAARKPYTANYKGHRWPLETGQLVTTSADLGLALCDRNGEPTSRHSVERMLAVFEKEGMISVHTERRKGTLITVVNYAEYAEKMSDLPAHNKPSAGVASEAHPAHIPEHKAAHHEQEGNNKNINNKTPLNPPKGKPKSFDPMDVDFPEWLSKDAWQEWVQYRTESRKSINSQLTVTKAFKKLQEYMASGIDPVDVINHSIANSYQGLYPPKDNHARQQGVAKPSKPMNHIPEGFTG